MKRGTILLAALLASGLLRAETACIPNQTQVIRSESRCVDEGGISIGMGDEEGAKVACMESKAVQNLCGPDGRLTRLHAYESWMKTVKNFEDTCALHGGTFAYQDPNFVEPGDESFCRQAVPEVGSSMFEEPLCNFRSACPAVTVVCERTCPEPSIAFRF